MMVIPACRQISFSIVVPLLLSCQLVTAQINIRTEAPSDGPSDRPSDTPSATPTTTMAPSATSFPSEVVSEFPTSRQVLALNPSVVPSMTPSSRPSLSPTFFPTLSEFPTPMPTGDSTMLPSDTPSVIPTDTLSGMTTDTPTGMTADTPTTSPVMTDVDVEGTVVIILRSVAQIMPDETIPAYNELLSVFFADNFPSLNDVGAVMTDQVRIPAPRFLRKLQDSSNLLPLQTTVEVTAKTSIEIDEDFTLDDALALAVNTESTALITLLQDNTTGLVDPLFFRPITAIDAYGLADAPTLPPEPTPTAAPVDNGEVPDVDDGGGGISIIVIIVVVAGAVVVAGVGGFCYMRSKGADYGGDDLQSARRDSAKVADAAPVPTNSFQRPHGMTESGLSAPATEPLHSAGTSRMHDTDMSINDNNSVQHSRADASANMMGSSSNIDTDYGADNMSYTFSLDAGHVGDASMAGKLGASVSSGMQGMSIPSYASDDVSESLASQKPAMVSRVVNAPPGKLGIVIDTTLEGPVIHKVNPNSPLEGTVFPGDIIVAIDDVDTRAMSASAITALMVKTANQQRRLTVLSEDVQ